MSGKTKRNPKSEISSLSKYYLIVYNLVQLFGWSKIVLKALDYSITTPQPFSYRALWDCCAHNVMLCQIFQTMEILHASIGIVPSSPAQVATQTFGRMIALFGILYPIEESRDTLGVLLTLIAWCSIELVRYPYYAINLYGLVPFGLTWLRYTAFIPLYPMGLIGELMIVYRATPTILNKLNLIQTELIYYAFTISVTLFYLNFFTKLYRLMFRQRRKTLQIHK